MPMIFRNRSDYIIDRNWSRYMMCRREFFSKEMQAFLQNPEQHMQENFLKIDREKIDTTTVALTQVNRQEIVVKRYNIKNFRHGCKRAITPSRAYRSFRSALLLLQSGINTPQPIAVIEKRFGWFRLESYFIYQYLPGRLASEIFSAQSSPEQLQFYSQKMVTIFKKLFSKRFIHGDMKATNILFHDDEPYFLDLDSIYRHRNWFTFSRAKRKEINRFLMNWQTQTTLAEFLRKNFKEIFFVK